MRKSLLPCRTATLYVAQGRGQALHPSRRVQLWIHLMGCVHCRRYAQQSRLVEELARRAAPVALLPRGLPQHLAHVLREAGGYKIN